MAAVYRVRHKLLKIANPDIKRRLVEEGRVQASLHHPNIVAVTDVLVVEGQPGLLMELVDGPTLEEWLWSNRPTLEQAESLFRGVVAGVGRAHRAGLVHRDLKPGNILLDVADGAVIPKVTDFGLAKILADEDRGHSQTRSGVTLGTPQFMAPEQIRNAKTVDQRADIFALGCILYNLVCGRPPFQDPDILNLYNAIASGTYPPPETFAPGLPPRIRTAIAGALTVDREARTQDCEALRAAMWPEEAQAGSSARMWQSVQTDTRSAVKLVPAGTRMPGAPVQKAASTIGASPSVAARATPPSPEPTRASTSGRTVLALAALSLGLGIVGAGGLATAAWFAGTGGSSAVDLAPEPTVNPGADPGAVAAAELAIVPPAEPEVAGPKAEAAESKTAAVAATERAEPATAPRPAADPKPTPEAQPAAAKPVTDPKPAADPAPATPSAPTTAHVSVTGAVDRVVLQSGGRSYAPGALKPGTYTVSVQFSGRSASQSVGTLTLVAGQNAVIACDSGFAMCKLR
jgi:serine/threonine-protein kinase